MYTKLLYWYHNELHHNSKPNTHRHPFYQLEIVLQGAINIEDSNTQHKINAPAIAVIPPNIEHTISKKEYEGEAFSFKLQSPEIKNIPQKIFTVEYDSFTQWLTETLSALILQAKYPPITQNEIITSLFSVFFTRLNKVYSSQKDTEPELFHQIREFVLVHGRLANIDNTAAHLHCTSNHLKYIFRKTALENPQFKTGTSPKIFIDNIILEMIERYLKYSKMSISQIAKSTKFPDIYKLSRFYFRMCGISPSEARRNSHRLSHGKK